MPDPIATSPVTRADLYRVFPNNPKMVLAFEQLFRVSASNALAVTAGVAGTEALVDATVVTLSSNAALGNERVLAVDPAAISITDYGPGQTVVLGLKNLIIVNGGFACTFNLAADTNLTFPTSGVVPSSDVGPYANDAAAAAAGVQIGEIYKQPSGVIAWRQV